MMASEKWEMVANEHFKLCECVTLMQKISFNDEINKTNKQNKTETTKGKGCKTE